MALQQDLVQLFGFRGRELDGLRGLVGGVTATHLRTVEVDDVTLDALEEGLSHPNPRVRWWCVQLLDHIPDARALGGIALALDDPVPRVRRNAAHALGCFGCKPNWNSALPSDVMEKLMRLATEDPNVKVRNEAKLTLAVCRART